ncbi:G-protein coupled receptor moody-like isoform X1 [Daphnia pulex]|uniref:G-protein coupled receptor moody-like isoform X1 n=1 Tax=Daphnia pulex TaxID=6669 RepID=UPI001EDCF4EA|nr:G-protein coupled receptor moody-like isoform X1 [Daphnia pulex]XP_046444338.1 G-protein coupled receptor moody-like isoform X1 [Daphnia pulex]
MEFVADGADNCSHLNSASDRLMAILQNGHHINTSAADANDLGIYNDIFLSRSSLGLRRFSGVMTIFIIVMGVLGNALTIAALIKCPKIRNLTVAFITSLCVADFSFCVMVMPFTAYRFLNDRNYFGDEDVMCIIFPLVQYANVGVSLLSIAMITINRFVMIAYPHWYKRIYTRRSVAGMVAFAWIFSISTLMPTLSGRWGKFGFDTCLGSCSIVGSKGPKTTLFLIGFLTPCLAIVICYAGIFWTVNKSRTRVQGHAGTTAAAPGRTGSDWRLTKMILIIFVSFIVCYLPTAIIKIVDKEVKRADAHVISYVLIYFSACINPIIYVTMNRQFRQAYKDVLFCTGWTTETKHFTNSASGLHGAVNRTAISNASVAMTSAVHHPEPERLAASQSKRISSNPVDIPLHRLSNAC